MMRKLIVEPVIRSDVAGDGHFGAPRGSRTHRGIDYLCEPGTLCFAPVSGTITKLGYPYADDQKWRYVEIQADDDLLHRVFYIKPVVRLTDYVHVGEVIGETMDISERYPGQNMLPHVHYEIKTASGDYINPEG